MIPGLGRSPGGGHGNPLQYSFLENSHGQRSLAGYSPWGGRESDTTGRLSTAQHSLQTFKTTMWTFVHIKSTERLNTHRVTSSSSIQLNNLIICLKMIILRTKTNDNNFIFHLAEQNHLFLWSNFPVEMENFWLNW